MSDTLRGVVGYAAGMFIMATVLWVLQVCGVAKPFGDRDSEGSPPWGLSVTILWLPLLAALCIAAPFVAWFWLIKRIAQPRPKRVLAPRDADVIAAEDEVERLLTDSGGQ